MGWFPQHGFYFLESGHGCVMFDVLGLLQREPQENYPSVCVCVFVCVFLSLRVITRWFFVFKGSQQDNLYFGGSPTRRQAHFEHCYLLRQTQSCGKWKKQDHVPVFRNLAATPPDLTFVSGPFCGSETCQRFSAIFWFLRDVNAPTLLTRPKNRMVPQTGPV